MQVPHRGGDRIHVTVKKFKGDVNAAFDRVSKTTEAGFMAIQRTLTTTLVSYVYKQKKYSNSTRLIVSTW